MTHIYVLDMEEFHPFVQYARDEGYKVTQPVPGYWKIAGEGDLRFRRKEAGLNAALWNTVLGAGISGDITHFDKYEMVIGQAAA